MVYAHLILGPEVSKDDVYRPLRSRGIMPGDHAMRDEAGWMFGGRRNGDWKVTTLRRLPRALEVELRRRANPYNGYPRLER